MTALFGISPSGRLTWIKEQKDFLRASPGAQRMVSFLDRAPHNKLYSDRYLAWLESAYVTFSCTDRAREVCHYWSKQCDQVLAHSWKNFGLNQEPLALFALGKLGALELNLSSDVDLMIVSESAPSNETLKKVREWKKSLEELTEFGWLFRVDLDLRPGGAKSPMITSLQQFQDYYWSYGESWERLALIRLRPLCGQDNIQKEVLDLRSRFSFPKYHYKNVVDDLLSLRKKIFENIKKQQKEALHLKLQPGGIRDIELCVHAMQTLLGGREKHLQSYSTEEAFHRFNKPDFLQLREIYWQLRQYENQVQAVDDQQKHDLDYKNLPEGWNWPQEQSVLKLMGRSERLVLKILKPSNEVSVQIEAPLRINEETQEQIWPKLTSLAELHSKVGQHCLKDFIDQLNQYRGPQDQALLLILELFKSFRFHKEYFQVFAGQQGLIKDLVNLFVHAPTLGHYLARRPDLFDDYLQRKHSPRISDASGELSDPTDLVEKKMVFEAIYAQDFIKNKNMVATTINLSELADNLLIELKNRKTPDIELVALGKWGGKELGFRSDIDFIFLSKDPAGTNKQARTFISQLTAHTSSGKLYDLDLRLRPSGQSGPVIVTAESWLEYIENSAPPWQRQAYLKSRLLGNNVDFKKTKLPVLTQENIVELKRIHRQLCEQNHVPEETGVDLKYHPGGLLSIEFFVQWHFVKAAKWPKEASTLSQLEEMKTDLSSSSEAFETLRKNYIELRKAEQYLRLNSNQSSSKFKWISYSFSNLCLWLDQSEESYKSWVVKTLQDNQKIMQSLDPL